MTEEEQVIRDWLAGQLNPVTGAPLPPSRRTSRPLPRRQVTAVVATLIELLDEARAERPAAQEASPNPGFVDFPINPGFDFPLFTAHRRAMEAEASTKVDESSEVPAPPEEIT